MKLCASILLATLLFTSCDGHTQYGKCIGVGNSDAKPELIYEISVWNTVWSFIFVETIFAPILWATTYAQCPVGKK